MYNEISVQKREGSRLIGTRMQRWKVICRQVLKIQDVGSWTGFVSASNWAVVNTIMNLRIP
jgi:hypothetical protein